jgi:uncharacterized membrane protein YqjE
VSATGPGTPPEDKTVGELVFEVSERVSSLVREEVELAKAEISEKVSQLARGSAVAVAAGVFALLGFAMLMHAIAWLLDDLFFEDHIWIGFAIEAFVWFVIAAIAGLIAYRAFQKGAPPTPDMAIEEAKRVRQTLESGTTPAAKEPVTPDPIAREP